MKHVQAYIESKQSEFIQHPFFTKLNEFKTLKEISYFVPQLTFWAMTFQDILRINEEKVKDPYLKKIARHHRMEDSGHEKWFLQDKKYILETTGSKDSDNVTWLYGKEQQITRDAAYAIMAEIYNIDEEILNVVLLLTLESSGHIFFEKVADQVKKAPGNDALKYFSSYHLDVEKAHAIFEDEMERKLFERNLPISTRRKALKMIDRAYVAFNKMFDGLLATVNQREAQQGMSHGRKQVESRTAQTV